MFIMFVDMSTMFIMFVYSPTMFTMFVDMFTIVGVYDVYHKLLLIMSFYIYNYFGTL